MRNAFRRSIARSIDSKSALGSERSHNNPSINAAYREYPLPPGLGAFPLENVKKHAKHLPAEWAQHGGALLPMYQSEALWLNFGGGYPCAVKIAAGKINAVTGEAWSDELVKDPQDYLVVPDQPWLDGFCVQKGLIRQFVAMPLGQGYTAEEQLTGSAEHGGLQIIVYPMKRKHYKKLKARESRAESFSMCVNEMCCSKSFSMGLAPGGLMRQEIYEDDYGYDAWDLKNSSRCFVHILNSTQWEQATGQPLPDKPPTAEDYSSAGLPWFEYYDDRMTALPGAKKLAQLDSVAAAVIKNGLPPLPQESLKQQLHVIKLDSTATTIQDGAW